MQRTGHPPSCGLTPRDQLLTGCVLALGRVMLAIFDVSDDSGSKFDSGKALRVRSSFGRRFYRPRFDVAMPLHPRWFLSADAHKWPPRARPLLASFRGSDTDPVGLGCRCWAWGIGHSPIWPGALGAHSLIGC